MWVGGWVGLVCRCFDKHGGAREGQDGDDLLEEEVEVCCVLGGWVEGGEYLAITHLLIYRRLQTPSFFFLYLHTHPPTSRVQ